MRWLFLSLIFLTAACSDTQPTIQERGLLGCEAWTAAFEKVTTRRELGIATVQEINLVNRHRPFLNGLCLSGEPISGETTITRLENVLLAIIIARGEEP